MKAKTIVGPVLLFTAMIPWLIGLGERVSVQLKAVFHDPGPGVGLETSVDLSLPSRSLVQPNRYHGALIRPRGPICACVIRHLAIASVIPPWWPSRGHPS
jgi:hypothetical protein